MSLIKELVRALQEGDEKALRRMIKTEERRLDLAAEIIGTGVLTSLSLASTQEIVDELTGRADAALLAFAFDRPNVGTNQILCTKGSADRVLGLHMLFGKDELLQAVMDTDTHTDALTEIDLVDDAKGFYEEEYEEEEEDRGF